ncbi:hypothetical protein [Saccharopolyspora hattusasensis]|uniref:hypothetical protein n=1 Tax=Saccharopolyspora hattusasensis TaxID=1128679 RepID=UPI003D99C27B
MTTVSNRVQVTHRLGTAMLGTVLVALAVVELPWTSHQLIPWLAMSVAVAAAMGVTGLLLICSAPWGSRTASSVGTALGALYLLAGLVHLALLDTSWNVFDFALSTALFCIIAGMLLLLLGLYGRVSGGLPPDNPYRRENPIRTNRPDPDEQLQAERADERKQRLIEAEFSVALHSAVLS